MEVGSHTKGFKVLWVNITEGIQGEAFTLGILPGNISPPDPEEAFVTCSNITVLITGSGDRVTEPLNVLFSEGVEH